MSYRQRVFLLRPRLKYLKEIYGVQAQRPELRQEDLVINGKHKSFMDTLKEIINAINRVKCYNKQNPILLEGDEADFQAKQHGVLSE